MHHVYKEKGKREITDGIELLNQENIRTLGEKEIFKWWHVIRYVAPTICGGSLLKGKRYKRCRQKSFHNKAIQIKIYSYIKYMVKIL